MPKATKHETAIRIVLDPFDPDVVLVVTDGSEPSSIPVIPTPLAISYWTHPGAQGAPKAS